MKSSMKCHKNEDPCRLHMQGFLRASILLILSHGESYGYTLQQDLITYGLRQQVDIGSIYRNLRALEEAGFVKSEWHDSSSGPEKRVYMITARGQKRLQQWKKVLQEKRQAIDTFLAILDAFNEQ